MSPRGERPSGQSAAHTAQSDYLRDRTEELYRLTTTHTIKRAKDSDVEPAGEATVTVTGHHVRITGVETDPLTVRYTDLNSVRRERKLLRRWFVLDTDGETYRLVPDDGDDPSAIVDYVRSAVWAWRDAARLLEDARDHVTAMGQAIEVGDTEQTTRERRQVDRALAKARGAAESTEVAGDAITAEADRIDVESARTRVQRHLMRAASVRERAGEHHEACAYHEAAVAYRTALDHVETAADVAETYDFREADAVESDRRQLRAALAELSAEPLARAQQALRAVHGTDDPCDRFEALRVAYDRYRTVLEVGWGQPDVVFEGDTDAVRMQISWLVARLAEAAHAAADDLAARAAGCADEDDATALYREASATLDAAIALARQYRQGDVQALETRQDDIDRARVDVEWQWGGA